jgi:hypothetical protein
MLVCKPISSPLAFAAAMAEVICSMSATPVSAG